MALKRFLKIIAFPKKLLKKLELKVENGRLVVFHLVQVEIEVEDFFSSVRFLEVVEVLRCLAEPAGPFRLRFRLVDANFHFVFWFLANVGCGCDEGIVDHFWHLNDFCVFNAQWLFEGFFVECWVFSQRLFSSILLR